MKKQKRNLVVVVLLFLLLAIGIGYAALGGVLEIVGTVRTDEFRVEFVAPSQGIISGNGQVLTVTDIILRHPGDSVELSATVENTGTSDAILEGFVVDQLDWTPTQLSAINITVTPATDVPLAANATQLVNIVVQWDVNSTVTVPDALTFSITANYRQDLP